MHELQCPRGSETLTLKQNQFSDSDLRALSSPPDVGRWFAENTRIAIERLLVQPGVFALFRRAAV